ncbi:MAG: zinc ribbon domain-containing protein [Gemmatimonadaceae bacterium]|jgi:hypothetical protein|nr:zinc ribbon domain-containing protein [Gemmatimonadaceae bacterium]MCU0626681.1 zinc ribbon domain-containing protein [Gemmatimonadaceae bacterium]
MSASFCAACGASLSTGARFCHRCGQPVGDAVVSPALGGAASPAPAPRAQPQTLPWAVAAIALLALVALVAGRNVNIGGSSTAAPANAGPIADPATGPFAGAPTGPDGQEQAVRAPDISSMTAEERANRLYNRLILLSEQGKTDSVQFFAPMAAMAFNALPRLGPLERFELGRVGELSGSHQLAGAQADTILRGDKDHLLGLALAAAAARLRNDAAATRDFEQRLLKAEKAQLARNLPEYQVARVDIDSALARARRAN